MTDLLKLKAWLCLRSAPKIKSREIMRLLQKWGDPSLYYGQKEHPIQGDAELDIDARHHLAMGSLPENYIQIEKLVQLHDIRMLCITDEAYPLALRQIFSPPLVLYYRGRLLEALQHQCLGVVGTRKPSSYGREMCSKTISAAIRQGVCIVSGLAMGIDTVAHLAAVQLKSPTIAVLAAGVENIYPPQNRDLASQIIREGALVSEYDPGSRMEKWNFPARNRLISAFSQAVYVVEGSITSGALLTAKFAIEQDRELMALPGQINHSNAQGPNYLIKSGARLISCPEDVLQALGLEAEADPQLQILPEISADEQKLIDLFACEQREINFDELILKTGLSFGKLSIMLLNLELKGYIGKASGNSFILR